MSSFMIIEHIIHAPTNNLNITSTNKIKKLTNAFNSKLFQLFANENILNRNLNLNYNNINEQTRPYNTSIITKSELKIKTKRKAFKKKVAASLKR